MADRKRKKLILLDAHAIIHRAYHALPEFTSQRGEPTGALYGLTAFLLKIIRELEPDYLIGCFDLPAPTFRKELHEGYKATRPKLDDALVVQLERSRQIFEGLGIPIYDKAGFEADDMIGTIVEELKGRKRDTQIIIASGDMDALQLVSGEDVVVYTLKKGLNDTIVYDEAAVRERFGFAPALLADYKGLRGDPSDNISGIRGIGEKTASVLVAHFGTIENMYEKLEKGPEEFAALGVKERILGLLREHKKDAFLSKVLGTIRRDAPIEFSFPKEPWRAALNLEKALKTFSRFDFKTLGGRLKSMFAKNQGGTEEVAQTEDPREVKRIGIALSLLDSMQTSPTLVDILAYTGADSLKDAEKKLFAELVEKKLDSVWRDIELPLMPVIERAEAHGVLVDVVYLKKLSREYHSELSKLEKRIYDYAGREFNVNSPKQLGGILFDELKLGIKGLKKTAGGARSTRESELQKLKEAHPIIETLLQYRELGKLLSTYIDTIPTMVDSGGRLHTNLNQTGTTTGRMSSSNPNLQNIPIKSELGRKVRNAFIAPPGYVLAAFDYSQIELRIAALLSGDKELLRIFKSGGDVHTGVAARVFAVPESEVTKEMRRRAKVINFGILYGMGISALRANLGSSLEEARLFYDNYFRSFPDLADFIERVKKEAFSKGYTETMYGRRRYFPDIRSPIQYIRAGAERMAVNAPIQGSQSDIIKRAMALADGELAKAGFGEDAHLVLQVHDELIYEIKKSRFEEIAPVIKRVMEEAHKAQVNFPVTVASGNRWGDL